MATRSPTPTPSSSSRAAWRRASAPDLGVGQRRRGTRRAGPARRRRRCGRRTTVTARSMKSLTLNGTNTVLLLGGWPRLSRTQGSRFDESPLMRPLTADPRSGRIVGVMSTLLKFLLALARRPAARGVRRGVAGRDGRRARAAAARPVVHPESTTSRPPRPSGRPGRPARPRASRGRRRPRRTTSAAATTTTTTAPTRHPDDAGDVGGDDDNRGPVDGDDDRDDDGGDDDGDTAADRAAMTTDEPRPPAAMTPRPRRSGRLRARADHGGGRAPGRRWPWPGPA